MLAGSTTFAVHNEVGALGAFYGLPNDRDDSMLGRALPRDRIRGRHRGVLFHRFLPLRSRL